MSRWSVGPWWPGILAMGMALSGCTPGGHQHGQGEHADEHGEHGHDEHKHGHDEHGHDEHGHEGHGEDEHGEHAHDAWSWTRWGEQQTLYLEVTPLVMGAEAEVSIHLTRREDHRPVEAGEVTFTLVYADGSKTEEPATPAKPGVFSAHIKPTRAGRVELIVQHARPNTTTRFGLPDVPIAEAGAEPDHGPHAPEGQAFTLEQQWRVPFGVAPAETRTLRPTLRAAAECVRPPEATALITAPRAGRIIGAGGAFPKLGQSLKPGEPLFLLGVTPREAADPATLDLAVDQADIQRRAARVEVDRLTPLVASGAVARRRLDEATAALRAAEARLKSARRRRRSLGQSAQVDGVADGLPVPSPISGRLSVLHVAPGAWVETGQPLAEVVDPDALWLEVAVPEVYLHRIQSVQGGWFMEGDQTVQLPAETLEVIGPDLDPHDRTLPVRFRLPSGPGRVAGVHVTAHLVVGPSRQALAVPAEAIVYDGGAEVLYVQTGAETFERRLVRTGLRDGAWIEITEGIKEAEQVVIRGGWTLKLSEGGGEIGHGHSH